MPLGASTAAPTALSLGLEPVSFDSLPGWHADDHLSALRAWQAAARRVITTKPATKSATLVGPRLENARKAAALDLSSFTDLDARRFFEANCRPCRLHHTGPEGLLTGYYEPELPGSLRREGPFQIPVFRRPLDLENLVAESERGAMAHALTHARRSPSGLEPYATRQEIEQGALAGRGLELVWLADPVDCFFMHVQGSGLVRLPDGSALRITYDGKNGHPYTSVGRYLIDAGHMTAEEMSLASLKTWLSADADRARQAMWQNKSFVFFRALEGEEAESALGSLNIPLSEGRSLAVDTAYHALGTPIFVSAPSLTHATGAGFHRLMIASDVGSAIRGPERGDIYFGSGANAGKLAGITKHPGSFFVLDGVV